MGNGTLNPTGTTVRWNRQADADAILRSFEQHYGDDRISIREFEIEDFYDASAAALIDYLMRDAAGRKACEAKAPTWLPEITFAEEETAIRVTSASNGKAQKQRILACGDGSDGDLGRRRIAKYEAAAEINETMQINRDCAADGCPGIAYYCDATKCYSPRDQLRYGPPATAEPVYTPSYGRSQFIGTTLAAELISNADKFSAEDKATLGWTDAMAESIKMTLDRGAATYDWWENKINAEETYAAANLAWSRLSSEIQAQFIEETGLGEREYTDIVRVKTGPPRNSKGVPIIRDARAAFGTTAVFSEAAVKDYLMEIFRDFDKFTIVAKGLMTKNMKQAKSSSFFDGDEEHLAAMVARAHNGGDWNRTLSGLTGTKGGEDDNGYVKRFLGIARGEGDWCSVRCTASFGEDNTVKPGAMGKGIGGLKLELIQEIPSCKMSPGKPLPERYYAVANKWKEFKWVHEVTSDMWRAGGQGLERADGSEMYEEYIFAKIDINGDGWCDWFLLSRTPFSTGGDSSVFNTLYLGSREGWRRIGVDIPKDEPDGLGWGKSDEQSSDYSFSSGHYLHYGIEQAIRLISLVFFSAQLWQGLRPRISYLRMEQLKRYATGTGQMGAG